MEGTPFLTTSPQTYNKNNRRKAVEKQGSPLLNLEKTNNSQILNKNIQIIPQSPTIYKKPIKKNL